MSWGKSSSDNSQSTTNTTTVTDRRVVADGGATVVGEGSTVNITDADSLQRAAALGEKAILEATRVAGLSQTGATDIAKTSLALAEGAFSELSKAYSEANTNAQAVASGSRAVLIGGLVLGGLWLLSKGKKA